jgi:hypothetical protein
MNNMPCRGFRVPLLMVKDILSETTAVMYSVCVAKKKIILPG